MRFSGGPCAAHVLTDRKRRVVRGQHQSNDVLKTAGCQIVDCSFNHGCRVLEAKDNFVCVWGDRVECALQCIALGFGTSSEWRNTTDGVVARDQICELFGCWCAAASNVGVVRLNFGRCTRRAVGHQENCSFLGHDFSTRVFS